MRESPVVTNLPGPKVPVCLHYRLYRISEIYFHIHLYRAIIKLVYSTRLGAWDRVVVKALRY